MSRCSLLLALLLCSCATFESGRDICADDFSWIQKGETTKSEVVERLGRPTMLTLDGSGNELLVYQHTVSRASAANASALNPFYTKMDTDLQIERGTVRVNDDGIVVDWEFTGSSPE